MGIFFSLEGLVYLKNWSPHWCCPVGNTTPGTKKKRSHRSPIFPIKHLLLHATLMSWVIPGALNFPHHLSLHILHCLLHTEYFSPHFVPISCLPAKHLAVDLMDTPIPILPPELVGLGMSLESWRQTNNFISLLCPPTCQTMLNDFFFAKISLNLCQG